jgi:Transglutaminase-like superfamily
VVILASWVGTLGWLTWRVYRRGGSTFTAGASHILPPDAYFFSVHAAGRQVGVASITVDTLADGVQITERLGLDLPINRGSSRSQFTSQYTIGSDLRMRDFRTTIPRASTPIVQQGVVEGDSVILMSPGTGEPRWRLRAGTHSLIPPLAAPVAMALQQKLRIGERLEVPVFDPATLTDGRITLAVLDDSTFLVPDSAEFDSTGERWYAVHSDTLHGWKLAWSDGRQQLTMWVDTRGLPIQVIAPAGLTLDRSAFEIVTINYRRLRESGGRPLAGNIVPRTALSDGAAPAGDANIMRFRITSDGEPWSPPEDTSQAYQHLAGDTVIATRVTLDSGAVGYQLPSTDTVLGAWLRDEPLLAMGETPVDSLARNILGDTRDPAEATRRLATWVAGNVGRTSNPVVSRAATVLRTRQGDVDGHTLVFVALARAAGLPARPVSGILLAGERFYLHSWAEVFLDRWVPVDPTWGWFPAPADRVRVVTGGLARPLELLPLLAGLEVERLTLNTSP